MALKFEPVCAIIHHVPWMNNPVQKEVAVSEKISYPIRVICVLDSLSHGNKEIQSIREYTQKLGLTFVTREYDHRTYSEDCNFIERLPAFHIYTKTSYRKTFYINSNPYNVIHETLNLYIDKIERKQKKPWKGFLKRCVVSVKKFFHKKTRMEKYNEENKQFVNDW